MWLFPLLYIRRNKRCLSWKASGKIRTLYRRKINWSWRTILRLSSFRDSKYGHTVITKRWQHVEKELTKKGIIVINNWSDGAGPFLKAMSSETKLFTVLENSSVPPSWKFFLMPELKERGLCSQDNAHLLAKLHTRLLGPSNIIVLGVESACRSHIQFIYNNVPKDRHGWTQQVIDNKDKQNYDSIAILVGDDVEECLTEASNTIRPTGTIIYLGLMRKLRDAHFEKGISPIKRVSLLWEVVFFIRIWRCWLYDNGDSETDHFITTNAYTCIELNAHLLINMLFNVINGKFPKEILRVWLTGSQACEQLQFFRQSLTFLWKES